MRKLIFWCLAMIIVLTISCGKSDEKESSDKSTNSKKQFELILEFKTPVNDKFKIFYTVVPNVEITGDHMIEKYIYGNAEMQKVTFKFPNGDLPHKIRLDVGLNQNVNNITIKNISLLYGDKIINGDEGEYMKYWSPNDCIKYDETNFVYTLIATNGMKTPVFIANVELQKKLRNLFK